jgi:hypothetical protein
MEGLSVARRRRSDEVRRQTSRGELQEITYVAAVCICCDTGAMEMASSRSIDILFDEANGDMVCVFGMEMD